MCGIAGAFSLRSAEAAVQRMTGALAHRGPDDSGLQVLRRMGGGAAGAFGHRRLAILDLSTAGHQPMRTEDGRYTIVFNGEIYNFRELRCQLEREGVAFAGRSDTEVVLRGWTRHGPGYLRRLRGMFAFAVWDSDKERGWVVRDPFGIKPLYMVDHDGSLFFASEVRTLLASGCVSHSISPHAVQAFLASGSVAEPHSIIPGVHALPPGSYREVCVEDDGVRAGSPTMYLDPFREPARPQLQNPREAAHRVREALRDSVGHHLVSDVPVGVFLSGGIDSSAIVAIASEIGARDLATFTVTFTEEEYNEAVPARLVAERFRTRHHSLPLSGTDLLASLPSVFAAMDQPSIDGLNTYAVSQAVRQLGIKVVLSGLGGDELFAGYPSFRRAWKLAAGWHLLSPLRRATAAVTRPMGPRGEKVARLFSGNSPAQGAYFASRMLFGDHQVRDLTGSGRLDPDGDLPSGLSVLQLVSWLESTRYMRNTLLRDGDVFSMAHGLELRVPFVDRVVFDAAMATADHLRISTRRPKPILLDSVRDLLPREVWDRPKRGFTLPFEQWLRGPLRSEVESYFTPHRLERVGLAADPVRRVWNEFLARRPGMNWSRPWALYTLVRWAEENRLSTASNASGVPLGKMVA